MTTFNWRRPLMEDNLWWKMTFNGRRPLMKDNLWKIKLLLEDDFCEENLRVRSAINWCCCHFWCSSLVGSVLPSSVPVQYHSSWTEFSIKSGYYMIWGGEILYNNKHLYSPIICLPYLSYICRTVVNVSKHLQCLHFVNTTGRMLAYAPDIFCFVWDIRVTTWSIISKQAVSVCWGLFWIIPKRKPTGLLMGLWQPNLPIRCHSHG